MDLFDENLLVIVGFLVIVLMSISFAVVVGLWFGNWIFTFFYPPFPNATEFKCTVTFGDSEKVVEWHHTFKTILRFALGNGVEINYDCERGDCKKCIKKLEEGYVQYLIEPKFILKRGFFFTCITKPIRGDIKIKA